MALKLLQPGNQPLGQYDGLDSEVLTLKGGEVVTFTAVLPTDHGAFDVNDGYVNPSGTAKRAAVTKTLSSSSRPLMLADEGISGYGTLFGAVVGGSVGQQVNGPSSYTGAVLGPHTATGSGKVTCWDKPGLYAVSLDACNTDADDGLQPTNTSLTVGAALTYTSGGLLTPTTAAAAVGSAPVVARFVEFVTSGSLVTSTNSMVTALNSPSGSTAPARSFAFATFYFNPPLS